MIVFVGIFTSSFYLTFTYWGIFYIWGVLQMAGLRVAWLFCSWSKADFKSLGELLCAKIPIGDNRNVFQPFTGADNTLQETL